MDIKLILSKDHVKMNQGNSVEEQCGEFGFVQNPFKTAKFVKHFCKKWQNNPSGNSHILLNNTQTQNFATNLQLC